MKGLFDNLKDTLGSMIPSDNNNNGQEKKSGPLNGMGGMLGATAVGGILGALLGGSKGLQKTAKNVAAVGAGAAVAGLAYSFLQKWRQNSKQQSQDLAQNPNPFANQNAYNPQGTPQAYTPQGGAVTSYEQNFSVEDQGALLLLKAMIFSARADGHIDESERQMIEASAQQLGANVQNVINSYMTCPLDPNAIAREVKDRSMIPDLYKLSAAVIYCDNFMEQSYLAGLAQALGIPENQKQQLDVEASVLRQQIQAAQ